MRAGRRLRLALPRNPARSSLAFHHYLCELHTSEGIPDTDTGHCPWALPLTLPHVDFYAGGRLGMGSTAIGSAPSRMST
jgi:hypothetical protein